MHTQQWSLMMVLINDNGLFFVFENDVKMWPESLQISTVLSLNQEMYSLKRCPAHVDIISFIY